MLTIHAKRGDVLHLGHRGEHLARRVVFDVSDWVELYGEGTVQLIAQRPGEYTPYPAVVTVEDGSVVWELTGADTALFGITGKAELQYYVGEMLAKSCIWRTRVEAALDEPSEEPPAAQQGWVDQVLQAGTRAEEAAARAEKAAENPVTDEEIAAAITQYLEEHPLEESDPTVPEWAKAKGKPSYTAEEVGALSEATLPGAINDALAQAKKNGEFDGRDGTSVTVSGVEESTEDGGSNVVAFSDGTTLTVKNGSKGEPGVVDISAAEVGQAIAVKAVDESGKPTEWEAVDVRPEFVGEPLCEVTMPAETEIGTYIPLGITMADLDEWRELYIILYGASNTSIANVYVRAGTGNNNTTNVLRMSNASMACWLVREYTDPQLITVYSGGGNPSTICETPLSSTPYVSSSSQASALVRAADILDWSTLNRTGGLSIVPTYVAPTIDYTIRIYGITRM